MKTLTLDRLPELFAAVAGMERLYIPTDDGVGQAKFALWQEGMALSDRPNTALSPKGLFFPQEETLMGFRMEGQTIELLERRAKTEPFVLFGVRACDCRSLEILDRVFLSDPVDTFYQARREQGTIVTLACGSPRETCFCTAFGIDPSAPGGDVTCWQWNGRLYWRANTEKGQALTAKLPLLEACGEQAVAEARETIRRKAERLPFGKLDLSAFGGGKTAELFRRPEWQTLSQACLGCGTCTFVCPTCQCYDIKEFSAGREVCRFRCWDSCMYSDFTKMSAGQPRPTQLERFRQRFLHKLVYFPENNEGIFGCVGCGRCLSRCPIHMNIVKVAKTLGGQSHES